MKVSKLAGAAAAAVAAFSLSGAPATAQYVDGGTDTKVEGEVLRRAPGEASRGSSGSRGAALPVTGGDLVGLAVLGLGATAAGTVLVRRSRVRTA